MRTLGEQLRDAVLRVLARTDEPFYTPLNALGGLVARLRTPERVVHLGERNPERTFYVIKDVPPLAGLASWHDRVLGYMLRAEKKGWIPVVVPEKPRQADDGTWYDFFKGPSDVSIDEVMQSRNVVFATCQPMIYKRYHRFNVARRHRLAGQIALSDAARAFIVEHEARLHGELKHPCVGIRYRGTDYRSNANYCPVGHAAVVDVDVFCDTVEADCRRWRVPLDAGANLYVMTEEQESLDAILKRFPKARYVEKERYANFKLGKYLVDSRLPTLTPKENNFFYLMEIELLSACNYLIGSFNGGSLMALNLNGNAYRGVHMISNGVS